MKIKVPSFSSLPLSELSAVHRLTGKDLLSPDFAFADRLALWAFFVRKPKEPDLTLAQVYGELTMDDFEFPTNEQPDPTSLSGLDSPTPSMSPPSLSES